jgi:hypothetical protein
MADKIWISWERQRRTVELSAFFEADLHLIIYDGHFLVRYLKSSFTTLLVLLKERPKILFVQNPSIVLALVAVLLKYLFGYLLVVDRHTNFKFDKRKSNKLKWKLFWCLSNFTLRHADYTIVTNQPLQKIINHIGAHGLVLQDSFPDMATDTDYPLVSENNKNAVFVCTYADDEPVDEVIEAFTRLGDGYSLYMTGNWKKKWNNLDDLPANIIATGFLSEDEYKALMKSVDLVIVFTTNDYTLTCGAYEALSLKKPALLSKKKALINYFGDSCKYCDEQSVDSIMEGVGSAFSDDWVNSVARNDRIALLDRAWNERAESLKRFLASAAS